MIFKILFAVCAALEFVFVPLFLKNSWPKKTNMSLLFKMISSTLFILCGIFAMKAANNNSEYAKLIIWGLAMGWVGDFFLHLKTDKVVIFGLGLFAFLAGHIFYIIAFQKGIYVYYPQAKTFTWYEIVSVIVLVGLIALYVFLKKVKAKPVMAVPVVLYAFTITYMLVKAVRLCVSFWAYGLYDHVPLLFITVSLGALLFVLSDASLGLILFAGKNKNQKLKWFNIGTYYAAQVLLASSIFLIHTVSYS